MNVIRKGLESEFISKLYFGLNILNTNEIILDFRKKRILMGKYILPNKKRETNNSLKHLLSHQIRV